MKRIVIIFACLFTVGSLFAQSKTAHAVKGVQKDGIGGFIRNSHKEPLSDVQVMVYKLPDTIIASGFTDTKGHFETSKVPDGTFVVKLIYPTTDRITSVTGVVVKKGKAVLDLSAEPPTADSSITYAQTVMKKNDKNHPKKR